MRGVRGEGVRVGLRLGLGLSIGVGGVVAVQGQSVRHGASAFVRCAVALAVAQQKRQRQ